MRRLLTPGWLAGHLLTFVLVAGMLGLAVWQYHRAAGGNPLSWGYTIQWPVFAGFVVLVWVREVRRALRGPETAGADGAPAPPAAGSPAGPGGAAGAGVAVRRPVVVRPVPRVDDDDDPEVAAYNRYLAWLNANPGARPADYPDQLPQGIV